MAVNRYYLNLICQDNKKETNFLLTFMEITTQTPRNRKQDGGLTKNEREGMEELLFKGHIFSLLQDEEVWGIGFTTM